MPRESLTKGITSHNPRAVSFRNTVNTVSKQDAGCVVCGGALKKNATKFCGLKCYRIIQRSAPLADRFWPKANKQGKGGCWLWTGNRFGSLGYGGFGMPGPDGKYRPHYAHRIAWELTNGPIPDDQHVLHHCDVPRCVNPAHLFLGTHRDNMEDASRKGRFHVPRPNAQKLTDAQVAQIRLAVATGAKQVQVAKDFGVTKACVCQLVNGYRRQPFPPQVA